MTKIVYFVEKMSYIRFNFCKFHGEITSKFIMFTLSWVIKKWWQQFGSVVYSCLFQELRSPHRWQKCKQTAKNDTFYRFPWHHPLITQLSLLYQGFLRASHTQKKSPTQIWTLVINLILHSYLKIKLNNRKRIKVGSKAYRDSWRNGIWNLIS